MKKWACLMTALFVMFLKVTAVSAAPAEQLAGQWAPVLYLADQSDGMAAPQNVFTIVNFDLDWRLNNNWYNLRFYPLEKAMYYSVVECETHYLISYYQYYPRYAGGGGHEHDMTGILAAIKKIADGADQLDMLVTYSNHRWQSWDGNKVRVENGHPLLQVKGETHEIYACVKNRTLLQTSNIYALGAGDQLKVHTGYRLIPLEQLWEQRQDIGQGRIFARWGYFDSYNAVKVAAPWGWNYREFNWLANPGELIQRFRGRHVTACNYLSNPYQVNAIE